MISYGEARARLDALARDLGPRDAESVPLADCRGRVLADAVAAAFDVPSFDNSAMDGFALRAADGLAKRRVIGRSVAGDLPRRAATLEGTAWEIATGAPLPEGYDTVVKVEDVVRDGASISLSRAPATGANVRRRGGDFTAAAPLLAAGTRLGPRHAMALAALGVSRVDVCRRPRIVLWSTGAELAAAPETPCAPVPGFIYDASGPYLAFAAEALGLSVTPPCRLPDDPASFRTQLSLLQETRPDLVVTTGAVSVGPHDFIAEALRAEGAEILFHRVAIRPGKPLLVARLRGTVIFSLPGNPVSTAVGWRFFVAPFLRCFLGRRPEKPRLVPLSRRVEKPAELRCFFKAALEEGGAAPLPGQGSHQIQPLLDADGWLVLPEGESVLAAGTKCEAYAREDDADG